MIILIDGYNLLKNVLHNGTITEHERQRFINQLGKYAHIKGHKIVLVFDAGPCDRPIKERVNGVYVVYSGVKESADDYIKSYMQTHNDKELLLVSFDRELRKSAAVWGIDTVEPTVFYIMMRDVVAAIKNISAPVDEQIVKTGIHDNPELDKLMQESLGVIPRKKDDTLIPTSRVANAQQMSKKERKLFKKIKKL